ncbi:MAG: FAD synthetase family protein [Eubacteriales bacterium]|nr:FAD synthetase family protein [Eubacteriales bacterium]
MEVYWLDQAEKPFAKATVVCLGMFDGVHLGHQALLMEGKRIAMEKNLALCVHGYDTLPVNFLNRKGRIPELTTLEEKLDLFEQLGADIAAIDRFNDSFSHMSGQDFIRDIVMGKLNAKHVVAGFNHRFGYKADSGRDELEAYCKTYGIGLSVISPITASSGALVSSTAIRRAILENNLELAAQMLGRPVDKAMEERVRGIH